MIKGPTTSLPHRRHLCASLCRANRSADGGAALHSLPDKVAIRTGPLGRLAQIKAPRQATTITTRVGSSFGGHHSLQWCQPPRNILLIKKRYDQRASDAMERLIDHLAQRHPEMNLIVEEEDPTVPGAIQSRYERLIRLRRQDRAVLADKIDLCVTLGGDGTILHVSSLFDRGAVPPVLSFSMGSLGFLLPFHIDAFTTAWEQVLASQSSLLLRMRLHQTIHEADGRPIVENRPGDRHDPMTDHTWHGGASDVHLMNEVALHRASSPHMCLVDAFVDGHHLTRAISDGLIIATPTGSTAYSLSAGGPIVHPSVQSLILTPICPRSLSFRTVLLPSDAVIQLRVARQSRSAAQVSVDGREAESLQPGQYIQVSMSPYPIPCINRPAHLPSLLDNADGEATVLRPPNSDPATDHDNGRRGDGWVGDLNKLLRFNAAFSGRGTLGGNGAFEELDEQAPTTVPSSWADDQHR